MNQFFYESRGREKIREIQAEGLRSQAFHRSGSPSLGLFHRLQLLIRALAGKQTVKRAQSVGDTQTRPAQSELN
jgi:hypothetical protein